MDVFDTQYSGDSILAGEDGAVAELAAVLCYDGTDGIEKRGPGGVGGGGDHDLTGLNRIGFGHGSEDADRAAHRAGSAGRTAQGAIVGFAVFLLLLFFFFWWWFDA